MIAVSSRPTQRQEGTVSFASTLYLVPILDQLLASVPLEWRFELRLGLQEALVNAAKHGNNLDPTKKVAVHFQVSDEQCWWVISDQGKGFAPPKECDCVPEDHLPCDDNECGRGLYILYRIFDQVQWNPQGTELRLFKYFAQSPCVY